MSALPVDVDEAPVPLGIGSPPPRIDALAAIGNGQLPAVGETLVHILAALLRIEDQIGAALAPAPKSAQTKE